MSQSPRRPEAIIVSPVFALAVKREQNPSVFLLHSAGWKAGFTVNGIPASFYL